MFFPLGVIFPNIMVLYYFKIFMKHPHTSAMKKVELEVINIYNTFEKALN
jgi:hypothetical protein